MLFRTLDRCNVCVHSGRGCVRLCDTSSYGMGRLIMTVIIFALLSGVLFGVGLTVSRMIDPSKVIGF